MNYNDFLELNKDSIIEVIKQNGYMLQFVKNQTEEICIEAIKQNVYSIKYVNSNVFKN